MQQQAQFAENLDERTARLLKTVFDEFDKEDLETRQRQLANYRKLKLYWNSLNTIYYDSVARDYRIMPVADSSVNSDQDYYDRPVNVYRAFLETIIAALSIQIPGVECVPDDADDPLDLSTAKAGTLISELIYRHNQVPFLWLQALYVLCTEGLIACYSYPKSDKAYGVYKENKYEDETVEDYVCPNCQAQLGDEIFEPEVEDPDDLIGAGIEIACPECGVELDPELEKTTLIIPKLVGVTEKPKTRICLEVYGGLYVKIANYAKSQEATPYLIFSYETHYANVLEMYPELDELIPRGGQGLNDPNEQYARLNVEYRGDYPTDVVTVKQAWLRPAAFNIISDEDDREYLRDKFPDGAKVILANDVVADYENECLDDFWTLTQNPLSDYLTHEPLGQLLTNIQDITNDLISLTLQTIEHGIAQTWADPSVVNFDAYSKTEAMPGTISPTKPVDPNRNISDAFYSTQMARLSPEVFSFYRIIQELGQFVSGALPSLFGGQPAGSRTASEYAMSKGMAMQRLQTPWKMLNIWWKKVFGKAIPMYIREMTEDVRDVRKDDNGNFINVFIRKAETQGTIGDIELDSSDSLPISEEQQREIIMQLLQLNNMEIIAAMSSPENLPFLRKIVRIPQFRLPGEDDRQKQYEEITELINSAPVVIEPDELQIQVAMAQNAPAPMPQEIPSVEIDPDIDNHQIEAEICRSWLISEAGRLAKLENPAGYKNVLLHMKQHTMILQQQQMIMMQAQSAMNAGPNPEKQSQEDKIREPKDARTPLE